MTPIFTLHWHQKLNAQRIVDLGCDTGTLTCELAIEGRQIIGVDPSAAMLSVAKKARR
ncbi:MAG: class I SAM-dependent methyltransferase [Chloroflexales bacterium]|nr:class I SAM-dependent methyltransferase [Chloroflexales bacterium]